MLRVLLLVWIDVTGTRVLALALETAFSLLNRARWLMRGDRSQRVPRGSSE